MCGIAGILVDHRQAQIEHGDLQRMAAMLRHRGPDGLGFYLDQHVGLAHTRLSIIDLAGGAQPLCNEDGSIWITFNGEIFDYIELRATLESHGHVFRTRSDTEVIVHAYEQWGEEAWRRFNGQFACALWDSRHRRLWLVRDRVGILPLYYCVRNGRVLFASEAKALFASGYCPPRLDPSGLHQAFTLWSTPSPQTVFEGVSSVEPGTALCFEHGAPARLVRYWQPEFAEPSPSSVGKFDDAVNELEQRLIRSVALRLRADVPVGAYLSGGLDSSLLTYLAMRSAGGRLQTFGLRFEQSLFDEGPWQRRMAALLGVTHHEITCGPNDIRGALADAVWACEAPLLRTAPAPLILLSGMVQRQGMKVVLTGEGADELFAGYDIFKEDAIRRFWAKHPQSTARPALFARVHHHVEARGQTGDFWQAFFGRGLTEVNQPFSSHRVRWENTAWGTRFLNPAFRAACSLPRLLERLDLTMPHKWRTWSPLAQAQAVEIVTFLSPYLLAHQGDRPAMANGVEARYPFLDPDVIALALTLPPRFRLRGLKDKVLLRALARRHLTHDVAQRPKWPYRAPIAAALLGPDVPPDFLEPISTGRLEAVGLWDPAPVTRLFDKARTPSSRISEREEMALVGILSSQMLAAQFLDGFDARARALRRQLDDAAVDVWEDRRCEARQTPQRPAHARPPTGTSR